MASSNRGRPAAELVSGGTGLGNAFSIAVLEMGNGAALLATTEPNAELWLRLGSLNFVGWTINSEAALSGSCVLKAEIALASAPTTWNEIFIGHRITLSAAAFADYTAGTPDTVSGTFGLRVSFVSTSTLLKIHCSIHCTRA